MSAVDIELLSSLFLLPETITIEAVYPTKSRLTLQISCTLKSASCPLCQQLSERIHGKYGRTVLPGSSSASRRSLTRNNASPLSKSARATPT